MVVNFDNRFQPRVPDHGKYCSKDQVAPDDGRTLIPAYDAVKQPTITVHQHVEYSGAPPTLSFRRPDSSHQPQIRSYPITNTSRIVSNTGVVGGVCALRPSVITTSHRRAPFLHNLPA